MLNRLLIEVGGSVGWARGGVPAALNIFIFARLHGTLRQIQRITERIQAGTYRLRRRSTAPRAPVSQGDRPPRPPGPVRQSFGWLMPLLPMPYWNANSYRAGVESLFEDKEMVALIRAAPVSLGRPLRSLCWMFRVKPPPILARPRSSPRSSPKPPPAPMPEPPQPAAPAADTPQAARTPASAQVPPPSSPPQPRRTAATPKRPPPGACGPPNPA
jgi:hypothetical protein